MYGLDSIISLCVRFRKIQSDQIKIDLKVLLMFFSIVVIASINVPPKTRNRKTTTSQK